MYVSGGITQGSPTFSTGQIGPIVTVPVTVPLFCDTAFLETEIVAVPSVAFIRVNVYAPIVVNVVRAVPNDTVSTFVSKDPPVTLNSGASSPAQIHCASVGQRESLMTFRVIFNPSAKVSDCLVVSVSGVSNLTELLGFGVGTGSGTGGVVVLVVVATEIIHFVLSVGSIVSPCSAHVIIGGVSVLGRGDLVNAETIANIIIPIKTTPKIYLFYFY